MSAREVEEVGPESEGGPSTAGDIQEVVEPTPPILLLDCVSGENNILQVCQNTFLNQVTLVFLLSSPAVMIICN